MLPPQFRHKVFINKIINVFLWWTSPQLGANMVIFNEICFLKSFVFVNF